MAIIGTFIGIDDYADVNIRNLAGAKKDAIAMWALFSDSIVDLQSQRLINEQATSSEIRNRLDETISKANATDIVIFFFAGHGSPDHRLVAYDTDLNNLADTSISMDEIAECFGRSNAKVILCILDCCFSGGAPARVLDNIPLPRNLSIPLRKIAGEGRLLIAASKDDQPSYEIPGGGHGIFTNALLDILQNQDTDFDITSILGDVIDKVRADSNIYRSSQEPTWFGHIEGGLKFPPFKIGNHYLTAFPDKRLAKVTNNISDLESLGIPASISKAWNDLYPKGLNDLQLEAINEHQILAGESLLVVAPTSSGKTFIGEMAAARTVVDGRKAVFLLPYRALVNEKYDQFSASYTDGLGWRVIRASGDYLDDTGAFLRGKYDLALLTYEMFLNLVVGNPSIINQIGLVVIDEAQFITDPTRGVVVELLLTYLLTARSSGVKPQLIALSAVIGNINHFDEWLECRTLITQKRPVPLLEGVLDRSGVLEFANETGDTETTQYLPHSAIYMRKDKPRSQDMIVPLVKKLVADNEKVIVFRNIKGEAQGCAAYLGDELGLDAVSDAIANLPILDRATTSATLQRCLQGGTAFHNSNLTREERIIVEQSFRDPQSKLRVLAATTTVAAGINTPASTVILAENEFLGEDARPFTVAEYKNMAGRAGRLGFNETGKAIILAENEYERKTLFNRYVKGQLNNLSSSFDPERLETWLVRLLAQVTRVTRNEVVNLLINTYGGYLANRHEPGWRARMETHLESLLKRMIDLGLVEEENQYVQLTLLGRACGQSSLQFESSLRLVEMLRSMPVSQMNATSLMVLVQALPELDRVYTPLMRRGNGEIIRVSQATRRYSPNTVQLLQKYALSLHDYYGRCKRAAILFDWINGNPIEAIETEFTTNPYQGKIEYGSVRSFADATRFHLSSASHVANLIYLGQAFNEEEMSSLLKQLEYGLPSDAVNLLSIPIALTRGEYLSLYRAGIKTSDELSKLPIIEVEKLIGVPKAKRFASFQDAK